MSGAAHSLGSAAPARWLHPGAWWLWALGLAAAATRTINPLVLGLLIAVAWAVVRLRRPAAPWARSFAVFVVLGVIVVLVRVAFQVVLGSPMGSTLLFTLPEVPLPGFLAGIRLGGPVTLESLLFGFYDGMRIATMLICIGAASSLASPSRMLKAVPQALYEVGVAVVITLTFAPQLAADLWRVRGAQRLRGRPSTGVGGWRHAAMPVINSALERSVALAAAMDSRGYGRTGHVPRRLRLITQALLLGGMVGVVVGLYGLLDGGSTGVGSVVIGLGGVAAALAGLRLSGRRSIRTRYRPDPWALPEWLTSASGLVPAAGIIALSVLNPTLLNPSLAPVEPPLLTPTIVAILVLGVLPAVLTPDVPIAVRPPERMPEARAPVTVPVSSGPMERS